MKQDKTSLTVSGVGNGTNECTHKMTCPIAACHDDDTVHLHNLTVPIVNPPGDDLPGLLGLKTLQEHNSILDIGGKRLCFLPEGEKVDLAHLLPSGSIVIPLETAPSGHLVMTVDNYEKVAKARGGLQEQSLQLLSNQSPAKEPVQRTTISLADNIMQPTPQRTGSVRGSAGSSSSSRQPPRARVIDDGTALSQTLQTMGFATSSYSHHAVNTAQTHSETNEIRSGAYHVVAMTMPTANHVPPRRQAATIKRMSLWLRMCASVGSVGILLGLRGRVWQHPDLQALIHDGVAHENRVPVCAFGLHFCPEEVETAAADSYHAFTTMQVEPIQCRCKPGTDHVLELDRLKMVEARTSANRRRVEQALYGCLLQKWIPKQTRGNKQEGDAFLRSTPDCNDNNSLREPNIDNYNTSSHSSYLPMVQQVGRSGAGGDECVAQNAAAPAFPTAEKERAKHRKKAGIKPVKKPKVVEEHYDDLGGDLSGLGPNIALLSHDMDLEPPCSTDDSEHSDEEFLGSLMWAGLSSTTENTSRIECKTLGEVKSFYGNGRPRSRPHRTLVVTIAALCA